MFDATEIGDIMLQFWKRDASAFPRSAQEKLTAIRDERDAAQAELMATGHQYSRAYDVLSELEGEKRRLSGDHRGVQVDMSKQVHAPRKPSPGSG